MCVMELGLTQVVRDPTRENNILDLMLVTSPDRCVDIQVNPGISDHDAVCLTYEGRVKINKKKPRTVFFIQTGRHVIAKGRPKAL